MTETDQSVARKRIKRVQIPDLAALKKNGGRIAMVTVYNYSSALMADAAGVDVALVGDSISMMELGYKTVLPVTLDEMIHHVRAVSRGLQHALLLADMPFGSYQSGPEQAMGAAVRLLKEGGAQSVKLEGGRSVAPTVKRLVESGIPVMGHLGLTPQSVHQLGGHRAQAQDDASAEKLLEDALALQQAGVWGIVLEMIPAELGRRASDALQIPVIGIGAGPFCDGQVQVWHDLLGIVPGKKYRHVKQYACLGEEAVSALRRYTADVHDGNFHTEDDRTQR